MAAAVAEPVEAAPVLQVGVGVFVAGAFGGEQGVDGFSAGVKGRCRVARRPVITVGSSGLSSRRVCIRVKPRV